MSKGKSFLRVLGIIVVASVSGYAPVLYGFWGEPVNFQEEIKIGPSTTKGEKVSFSGCGSHQDEYEICLPQGEACRKMIAFYTAPRLRSYVFTLDFTPEVPFLEMSNSFWKSSFNLILPNDFLKTQEEVRRAHSVDHFLLPCDPLRAQFTDKLSIKIDLFGKPQYFIHSAEGTLLSQGPFLLAS